MTVTSWRDLLVLGVTGGLVPCPAGVTLVLYSLSFSEDNTLKCFVYLLAFSLGLGSVLIAIATGMVLTKAYFVPDAMKENPPAFVRWLPVVTAFFICVIGAGVCYQAYDPGFANVRASLGW